MKRMILVVAALMGIGISPAQAEVRVNIYTPPVYRPYTPRAYYYAPPPPPRVVYAPRPVYYVAPPPVYRPYGWGRPVEYYPPPPRYSTWWY